MVDLIKTRTQLIHRALASIGALEPGDAPSPEDYNTMDGLVDPLLAQLAADSVVYIDDSEAIKLEYFVPLANLLANMAGPDFGSPVNDAAKARDEHSLRRLSAPQPTTAAVKAVYY
jgi:hypothetical protein